ncbi:MAG: RHS repeat-associated core domain-containing protein [Methylococcaceae bacterium]|nr:RHS repeat-associated core domain-containing protein [Methylococcaceae bacterium]
MYLAIKQTSHRMQSTPGGASIASDAANDQQFDYDLADRLSTYSDNTTSLNQNGSTYLSTIAAATFIWNAAGRLSKAASGGQSYTYTDNGLGERILKNSTALSNGPYRFVYDHAGHLIGEYDKNNSLKQETVWLGDTLVAVVKPAPAPQQIQVYFIQADHLNAPRIILNNANIPVWRWDHTDAFGTTLPNEDPDGDGNIFEYNLRFPGQYYDKETGLHYNYFRDYDPGIGRYIQSDPIGLSGGLNAYTYVGNNPVNRIDPSGLLDVYGYQSRGGGSGWNTQYQLTFDPLSDNLQKAIPLPAWLKYTLKVIPQIDTKPVGPLHPIKDFLQCGKLDAKLKKDYEDIYGDQQRLTRDEAESFLNSMTEKYPEMNNLYPSPTDMLDQAEGNSRNNWYYMLRPE